MADLDCTTCGACCWVPHHNAGYTPLTPRDIARLPPGLVVTHRYHRLPVIRDKPRHGGAACAALTGKIGHHVACSVYAVRPTFCRTFKPGSRACHAARRAAGLTT